MKLGGSCQRTAKRQNWTRLEAGLARALPGPNPVRPARRRFREARCIRTLAAKAFAGANACAGRCEVNRNRACLLFTSLSLGDSSVAGCWPGPATQQHTTQSDPWGTATGAKKGETPCAMTHNSE